MYTVRRPVENVYLVREPDRRRTRELLALLLSALAPMAVLFAAIWTNLETFRLGYQIERLQKQKETLVERQRQLEMERARISALSRVESVARERLGLVTPGRGQIGSNVVSQRASVKALQPLRHQPPQCLRQQGLRQHIAFAQRPVRALPPASEGSTLKDLGRALGAVTVNARVLLLGLFNAASLAVGTGVLIWTPDFLESRHGSTASVAAYLTAGLAVAQLLGAPTGAACSARWGRMPVIVGAMVSMSVATALVPVVPGRIPVFVMVVLVGFFSLAYFSPRFAMIPEVCGHPSEVGPASGLINLLGFGISTAAPWLFGLALDGGLGYAAAYLVLAAFGMAGAVGALFFKAPRSRSS